MANSVSMSTDAPSPNSDALEDVQDFLWANAGEPSMPWERFHQIGELVRAGNLAFRRERYEEAINSYTEANSLKPGDPTILSNRSASYIRISRFLKNRPPTASEYSALNGMDPTVHAELALKDAEKVLNVRSNDIKAHVLKASALFLLERYDSARSVILSGLQNDPFSNHLQCLLQILDRACGNDIGKRNQRRLERIDEFDCTLCLKLLFEPVTTPCGHSFCRSCLFQSMDRSNKCPLCRTILFMTPRTCAVSVTLNNIIQKTFPEEYAERKSEHDNLTNPGVDLVPLFVMDAILPCQKLALNIFEPRYRLMVRRVMEGNHRMGMVVIDASGRLANFACEVEITECEPLPDGRFYIEVEGRRRFRIVRSWDQDGYRVAEAEWTQDKYPPEGTAELAEVFARVGYGRCLGYGQGGMLSFLRLRELISTASEYAKAWILKAKEAARRDRRKLADLLSAELMTPRSDDPECFSFWLATLTKLRPADRLELLQLRDTKERITRGLLYLKQEEQGCSLQ